MATSPLLSAIGKLAIAGEQAGFTVEQMIGLLNAGIDIETLVHMITERLSLQGSTPPLESRLSSCRWIM